MANDCIFCQIIAGEIPGTKIYEDDKVLAILDINPVNIGHVLVMPKDHFANIEETPEADLFRVAAAIKKVGSAIKNGLNYGGYNVVENNDPLAGQLIPHQHFHVIPRQAGDGLRLWPAKKYAEGEMAQTAEKLKSAL
jgi:histidine triad (HIT) family protein